MSAVRNPSHLSHKSDLDRRRSERRETAGANSSSPTTTMSVTYRVGEGLVIHSVVIDAAEVVAEALRWPTGVRGEPVDPESAEGKDLSEYHRTALCLGARVLQATADSATAISLAGMVTHLAEQAEAASANLVDEAMRASTQIIDVTAKATKEATEASAKIIDAACDRFHQDLGATANDTMQTVQDALEHLLGGEGGAAVTAMKEVIARAMGEAQIAWHRSLTTTLTEVSRTLDVSNPASPLCALERRMLDQQGRQHTELTAKLDQVQEMVGSAASAATTAAAVAAAQQSSPAKGRPYQETVGAVLEGIAAGLGASYSDTADTVGLIRSSKKGDAVMETTPADAGASAPRVVIEFTTQGHPRNWSQYLDSAERNRGAQASLGIVPSRSQVPGGDILAVVGANRFVLAFDPDQDEPGLLRAAMQLLCVQAQRRLAEARTGDLGLVDAKLDDARRGLLEMQQIIKTAVMVRNGAGKVVSGLENLHSSLTLTIDQARAALNGSRPASSSAA